MRLQILVLAFAGMALACNQSMKTGELHRETAPSESEKKSLRENNLSLAAMDSVATATESFEPKELKSPKNLNQKPPQPALPDWDKKIIRNAELSFEVKDVKTANFNINEAVKLAGGYIASSSSQQSYNEIRDDIVIRIPKDQFEVLVEKISGLSTSSLQKNITSQDVTEEYVDTKARVATREKVRDRYFDFIKQAKNVEEVMKVENEIRELQETIESATGRINYIQHQSALSTIHINFYQKLLVPMDEPKRPSSFWTEAWGSFKDGLWFLEELALFMIKVWPLTLLICSLAWYVKKKAGRNPSITKQVQQLGT